MAWFAAHELFTRLHHIRWQAEELLAGVSGPLALDALRAIEVIAAAARALEVDLRAIEEIERLRRAAPKKRCLRPLRLRRLLDGLSVVDRSGGCLDPIVLVHLPAAEGVAGALEELAAAFRDAGGARLHVGRRRAGIVLPALEADRTPSGDGTIRRRLALERLRFSGAGVRMGTMALAVLWRRAGPSDAEYHRLGYRPDERS